MPKLLQLWCIRSLILSSGCVGSQSWHFRIRIRSRSNCNSILFVYKKSIRMRTNIWTNVANSPLWKIFSRFFWNMSLLLSMGSWRLLELTPIAKFGLCGHAKMQQTKLHTKRIEYFYFLQEVYTNSVLAND